MDNSAPLTHSYDPPRIEERAPLGTPLIGLASVSVDDSAAFYAI